MLIILASAIAAAACQEIATSPQVSADIGPQSERLSNPPPPPIDTGALGSIGGGLAETFMAPVANRSALPAAPGFERFAGSSQSVVLHPPHPTSITFVVPATYLLNKGGLSGYLHFADNDDEGVDSDPNGMVHMNRGTFSGKGKITIRRGDDVYVIDLASVNSASSYFEDCPAGGSYPEAGPPEENRGGRCFKVKFNAVYLNDALLPGGATFTPTCYPGPENDFCNSESEVPSF